MNENNCSLIRSKRGSRHIAFLQFIMQKAVSAVTNQTKHQQYYLQKFQFTKMVKLKQIDNNFNVYKSIQCNNIQTPFALQNYNFHLYLKSVK